jgi:hypothetical protein
VQHAAVLAVLDIHRRIERTERLRANWPGLRYRATWATVGCVQIEELMERIRRLPAAQRKLLDEMVRSLEESPRAPPEQPKALQPVRGLLRDLGPAPSAAEIEDARRELWAGFPREDLS